MLCATLPTKVASNGTCPDKYAIRRPGHGHLDRFQNVHVLRKAERGIKKRIIATRVEAIASRLEAIAIRNKETEKEERSEKLKKCCCAPCPLFRLRTGHAVRNLEAQCHEVSRPNGSRGEGLPVQLGQILLKSQTKVLICVVFPFSSSSMREHFFVL